MNRIHHWICSSSHWKRTLADKVLPWVLSGVDLGSNVLEVGPGPGLTTELLRARYDRLTCIEIDPEFALPLRTRMQETNVTVIQGDATSMEFPDATFSGAISLTMLHPVPSPGLQDRLLAEVCRVLRPGGVLAGMDAVQSWGLRLIHVGDTLVPIDPATFEARLEAAGFGDVSIDFDKWAFRFRASRRSKGQVQIPMQRRTE